MRKSCSHPVAGLTTGFQLSLRRGGAPRAAGGAIASRYQKEWGTKIDKFDYITEMTKIAAGHIDQRLVRLFCEESAETIDWYGDRLADRGVELWHEAGGDDDGDRYIHFATGHSPRWTGSDDGTGETLNGAKVLTDYATGLGVEFMYNTPMVELVKENDRVVGIIAENEDGKYIRKERYSGSCSRSFYVGDAVTQDDVKAKFENGVLTLEVPKKEEAPKVEEKKYISIEG